MHHQYRPNNLEKLYIAQHYTYGYKGQLLLRALGRLGRCQGVLSHKKGHLGPKTGFPPLAPTSAWSCPQLAHFIFPLVYMATSHPLPPSSVKKTYPKSGPGRSYYLIGTLYMLGWARMPESGVVQVASTTGHDLLFRIKTK
ncbi:hypothetical protein FRACYDRAFT_238498 [Fragilariopsis cylindrus CCMP1102]|uniref:Uncharacterized protein n=1 Tax=Fragilariopsis cylindrus CCMP1102 TaxID=635003 RepID=A0A1E7FJ59_9STRA|nr:hypothetical protein FRACYDRAFT_238498 [Fragilariopsis cylindrus CCMP1102]|eukprot:OEU18065.1 hypothetical protein FRACYDRAFT_238498 [Fragilariopsis cylindrus CCMP1102]